MGLETEEHRDPPLPHPLPLPAPTPTRIIYNVQLHLTFRQKESFNILQQCGSDAFQVFPMFSNLLQMATYLLFD